MVTSEKKSLYSRRGKNVSEVTPFLTSPTTPLIVGCGKFWKNEKDKWFLCHFKEKFCLKCKKKYNHLSIDGGNINK